ncbi:MAG: ATP-binding protein [Candidatus Micrarchaeia archaeon]
MGFIKHSYIESYEAFRIDALPSASEIGKEFVRSIGKRAFAVVYDLHDGRTYVCVEKPSEQITKVLVNSIPGLELSRSAMPQCMSGSAELLFIYKRPSSAGGLVKQLISLEYGTDKAMAFLFVPASEAETSSFKSELEKTLSGKVVRSTSSALGWFLGSRINTSAQTDVYEGSEESLLLKEVLEDIDNSILSGDGIYKVMTLLVNDVDKRLRNFLNEKAVILSSASCGNDSLAAISKQVQASKPMLFGIDHASSFLGFYGNSKVNYPVTTLPVPSTSGIPVGTYLRNGVADTHIDINIDESSLNLGLILTGLPGSGKTSAAMSILDSLCIKKPGKEPPSIVVLSSTSEWDSFAVTHGLHLIRLYKDRVPINFFACGDSSKVVQFYEDLSVLLANASKAGPYKNPMEKCFLNAFRHAYKATSEPSAMDVYNDIEESIIKLHGKRNNAGVKYTKHGENIKSALENLRSILVRDEFSGPKWIDMHGIIANGVVFDMSSVSNSSKPYMYSLILNQVYSVANSFDDNGDDSLRLVICVEESQLLFDSASKEDTAATEDLSRRVQDFRKKGIALVLITHNAIDIPPQIRRMCQNKIYMKQAADTASIAAKDLVFSNADTDAVVLKLKHMDSRMAAMDYVIKEGKEKISSDSIFIKTKDYEQALISSAVLDSYERNKLRFEEPQKGDVEIMLVQCMGGADGAQAEKEFYSAQVESFAEIIEEADIHARRCIFHGLVYGKKYRVNLLNAKGKIVVKSDICADSSVSICI